MQPISNIFQSADWKKEKHVPVIEMPERIEKGKELKVTVGVGKEISHPNTTEHHIAWIDVYFHAEGTKFPCHLGRFEFHAHGASPEGPNTSTVYANPAVTLAFKTDKPGSVFAFSYCNVHGLWINSQELKLS